MDGPLCRYCRPHRMGPTAGAGWVDRAGGGADAAVEEGDLVNEQGGELGDVGEGGLADYALVPRGRANEDGGRGLVVGDRLDLDG